MKKKRKKEKKRHKKSNGKSKLVQCLRGFMLSPVSLRFVVTNEPLCLKSVQVAAIRNL